MRAPWELHRTFWNTVNFEPVSITTVAAYAAIAAAAVGAYSAYSTGQAQANAARFNAQLAENQAIATRNAATFQEARQRERAGRYNSTLEARAGHAGGTLEGSPLEVLGASAANEELDALGIRYSGSVEEAQARAQAASDRYSASIYSARGITGAGASLLTGASKLDMLSGTTNPSANSVASIQQQYSGIAYTGTEAPL